MNENNTEFSVETISSTALEYLLDGDAPFVQCEDCNCIDHIEYMESGTSRCEQETHFFCESCINVRRAEH